MDPAKALVASIATDPALWGLLSVAGADVLVAIGAAFRRGDFQPAMIGQWIGTHLLGRVMPIMALMTFARGSDGLAAIVGLTASAYMMETYASIRRNVGL